LANPIKRVFIRYYIRS